MLASSGMNQDDQEAYAHFKETLDAELRQNIKTVIMSLTMLAEDYKQSGAVIVKAIEEYIKEVSPDTKILGLYLMDSITKNLKSNTNYVELFQKNLVNIFTHVFSNVNEHNRAALYKLRQTWNNYFSNNTLFTIDITINKIDPAWPITAVTSTLPSSNQAASRAPTANPSNANSNSTSTSTSTTTTSQVSRPPAPGPVPSKPAPSANLLLQETKDKPPQPVKPVSPVKVVSEDARLRPNVSSLTAKMATSQIQSQSDPRLARDPRLAKPPKPAPIAPPAEQSESQSSPGTPKKQQPPTPANTSPNGAVKGAAPLFALGKSITSTGGSGGLVNGTKRTSPGSLDAANPIEIKKPKFSNATNNSSEHSKPEGAATTAAVKSTPPPSAQTTPGGQDSPSKAAKSAAPTAQPTSQAKAPKLGGGGGGGNENAKEPETKTLKPATSSQQPVKSTAPAKPVKDDKKENENVAGKAKQAGAATTQSKSIPSLFDVELKPGNGAGERKFKIGKISEKTAGGGGKANTNQAGKKQTNEKKGQGPRQPPKPANDKPKTTAATPAVAQKEDAAYPFQNDRDLRNLDAAPDTGKVESILRQISSLSSLVASESETAAAPARDTDSPGAESGTTETALANNSDKLSKLEARLNDSKENDRTSNDSKSSTLTLELTNAIRNLLEQQKRLLEQQKREDASTVRRPEPLLNLNQAEPGLGVGGGFVKPIIDPKITQLLKNDIIQKAAANSAPASAAGSSSLQDQVTYDLPPIRARDLNENQNDSLLIIDGRSYKIQPDVRRLVKIYYHDHELFCDTRTKDVYIDTKRVYKMGDPTKEVMLNGRRVRLMYMGKRIECWIDGISFHFRADAPPKQISLTSNQTNQIKRYYVTIDSRTMEMLFNNHRVCTVSGGPHGTGPSTVMTQLSPDDYERHEISFVCPPKRIMIDGVPRTMRYDLPVPCIEMDGGVYYVIRFSGPPKEIFIDNTPFKVPFDKTFKIKLHGRTHELAWGGPGFEVIIDGRPIELQFNKPAREINIGTRSHFIYIGGEAPDVKICGRLPYELYNAPERPAAAAQAAAVSSQPAPSGEAKPQTLDVQQLLRNLMDNKLIPGSQRAAEESHNNNNNNNNNGGGNGGGGGGGRRGRRDRHREADRIPDLTGFDSNLLRQKHAGAIESLYSGVQCATCGNRFNQASSGGGGGAGSGGQSRYAKHLDWHFRQNKREKEEINKAHSRSWYYSFPEWIQNEEISEEQQMSMEVDAGGSSASTGAQAVHDDAGSGGHGGGHGGKKRKKQSGASSTGGAGGGGNESEDDDDDLINAVGSSLSKAGAGESSSTAASNAAALNSFTSNGVKICAATNDIGDSCDICKDPFEIFWHNEKEEWYFKDAMRVGDRVYHPICYEDRDESMISSVPSTPTPATPASSVLNPLALLMSQQISQLTAGFRDSASSAEEQESSSSSSQVKDEPMETPRPLVSMHDVQMKEVA